MSISEKLTTIAENEQKVYDAGKENGVTEWFDDYITATNWIAYESYYDYAFVGRRWTKSNFKPSKDIKPINTAQNMFYYASNLSIDLRPTQFKEKFGVEFDVSKCKNLASWLGGSAITGVGTVDVSIMSNRLSSLFFSAQKLKIIEKIILPKTAEPSMNTTSAFTNCGALTTIEEITGLFGNSISFSSCPLEHDTIIRIMEHLADYSDGSYSKTLTLGSTNLAKLTDAEKVIATQKNWSLA